MALDQVVEWQHDLEALLVSTVSGVPLMHFVKGPDGKSTQSETFGSNELHMSALFSITAVQIEKMELGAVRSVTAFYQNMMLIHVNISPLVLTLIAKPGANAGALLAMVPSLNESLEPISAAAAETVFSQTTSLVSNE